MLHAKQSLCATHAHTTNSHIETPVYQYAWPGAACVVGPMASVTTTCAHVARLVIEPHCALQALTGRRTVPAVLLRQAHVVLC